LPAGTAYVADSTQVTAPVSGTVGDEFNAVSFSNNDGSVAWATNWIEVDGNGAGPAAGNVLISGGELSLDDNPNTGGQPSLARQADLSSAASATLSFDFRTDTGVDTSDSVVVEVSDNGGSSWTPLEDFTGFTGANSGTRSYDISTFMAANTQIRFRVNNLYGGSNEHFFVDNIQIEYCGGSTIQSGGAPPNLASGYYLCEGEQMAVTFQVTVNSPFDDPDGTVDNTASADSDQTNSQNSNTVIDLVAVPDILVLKSVQTLSDPVNGTTNPKAIPGAFVLYSIAATNQGPGATDGDTVAITDPIPANAALFVGDIDVPSSGPVLFIDGATASGLSYTFSSLASTTDDVEFSNNDGASYTYDPGPDADPDGVNSNVTHMRVNPKGVFNGASGGNNPSFELKFKVRVE
jgi:hypothetical protein